jgi:hypothetical protein
VAVFHFAVLAGERSAPDIAGKVSTNTRRTDTRLCQYAATAALPPRALPPGCPVRVDLATSGLTLHLILQYRDIHCLSLPDVSGLGRVGGVSLICVGGTSVLCGCGRSTLHCPVPVKLAGSQGSVRASRQILARCGRSWPLLSLVWANYISVVLASLSGSVMVAAGQERTKDMIVWDIDDDESDRWQAQPRPRQGPVSNQLRRRDRVGRRPRHRRPAERRLWWHHPRRAGAAATGPVHRPHRDQPGRWPG